MKERNRLRTSCAPAVGRGNFKKLEFEKGAVQPITRGICGVALLLGLRHICPSGKRHIPRERCMKRGAWVVLVLPGVLPGITVKK